MLLKNILRHAAATAVLLSVVAAPMARTQDAKLADWPHITSTIPWGAAMEAKIARMVAGMSLREKIGQMTQVEIKAVTPDEIRRFNIGSVLNGGGSWPYMMKRSTAREWLDMADGFYDASQKTKYKIPLLWGTDAVHGHSNVYGATLFPHNIGLGAAHDPELVKDIGAATGKAVRATGVNWAFAPTIAVVEDERWGRAYEGFSSDPMLVKAYASQYVEGLQGNFSKPGNIVATAKHYMGDGGTKDGVNMGVNPSSLSDMINIHGQGYYSAIESGVQTVMASYNSWDDAAAGQDYGRMHGSKIMLTDVLKTKIGFDGFVVSDWNGIADIPGCTKSHCAQAINAGIDMVMVPFDWEDFINNTVADVDSGAIPMGRIDDAVTRILRVKMRAHLFGQRPSNNIYAGKASALLDRDLGRRAVRESLVLLKNNDALPLKAGAKILVVGKSADNLSNQSGGWSLTWQGTENTNADFPNADSVLTAIKAADGAGNVTYSVTGTDVDISQYDAVIAVIGETPYAESTGDIKPGQTLAHSVRYPEDLAALQAVSGKGKPVITIFESGRTVYTNDLIDLSDAFVAAWLPGTEGKGVSDVLFGTYDFTGSLSFVWPADSCPGGQTLFPLGYGLSYAKPAKTDSLPAVVVATCAKP